MHAWADLLSYSARKSGRNEYVSGSLTIGPRRTGGVSDTARTFDDESAAKTLLANGVVFAASLPSCPDRNVDSTTASPVMRRSEQHCVFARFHSTFVLLLAGAGWLTEIANGDVRPVYSRRPCGNQASRELRPIRYVGPPLSVGCTGDQIIFAVTINVDS